ncbi:transposase [Salipiger sp. 1_MG-2023]|uniref:transposase n=1 Tax=Salipiger sp. 1_MG-2023 TaxID=3062665 RepID=UPI0026E3E541|nr:transposase [Salipiger sp. 1_MG-2023]MDO6587403.1 transposase [Salipiger sp. 1_MG-2023]
MLGAGRNERADRRTTWRNGQRDRALDTRLRGTCGCPSYRREAIFRASSRCARRPGRRWVPSFRKPRSAAPRRGLVQAMGLGGLSKGTVSKRCKDISERVGAFHNRPLAGEWPFVRLDETCLSQRPGGCLVSVAVNIAVAAKTESRREIIRLGLRSPAAETVWTEFLRALKARGLGGVKRVVRDLSRWSLRHVARVFEARWQRCRVPWMRNALAHVSKGQHRVLAAAIR